MNVRPLTSPPDSSRPLRRSAPFATSLTAAVCALSIWVPAARAQVFMNCKPVPLPSAYPSDWRSTHSLCRLLMTNSAGEPVRCDLRVQIDQNGSRATVTVPRQFNVGPTFLTTPQVTDWSRLVFQGALKDAMDRTGHLPAAPIKITVICENMFGLISNNPISTVRDSIIIVPSVPPPPTLLTPSDASQIRVTNPIFTWTPVRLTTGQEVWYQFRLVRVLAGQAPARALDANYPVLETFVHQSNLPYPSAAPRLEDGSLYAWRVQALVNASTDINDVPAAGNYSHLGLNEGRSRVYSFVWQVPAGSGAAARASRLGRVEDDGLGSLIGIGSDDHAAPSAGSAASDWPAASASPAETYTRIHPRTPTPSDSLALALFTPRRDWWGPTTGGRMVLAPSKVITAGDGVVMGGTSGADAIANAGAADASGTTSGTATDAAPAADMGAAQPSAGAPPRTPIAIDTGTPQGAGIATPWLRISGTSVAAGELYSHTGAGPPSRPDNNGQLMAGVTVSTLNDKLHVPLQMLVSGDQVSFRQSVNQIAVHPEFHWGGLHAGNIHPGYSPFSLADATLLGGGADVVRGNWYVGFVDGRMQKAILPDTVNAVEAQFARNVMAGRVGYGKPFGNAIEFQVMRARDDEGSLPSGDSLVHVAPAGNMVFGARARHTVFDTSTTVQVEGAWSRYDRNVDADLPVVNGGAGGVRIERRSMLGEIGAALDYVGGGFVTLANSELAPDRLEGRLSGRRELMAGKLRVGGTVGIRRDDLSGTLGGATHRRSFGAQVGWQPAALFGADFDLGVLSSRSPATEQRPGLKDLTTSFTLSPHLTWTWLGAAQALTTSLNLQATDYSDADAAGFANTRNTTVVGGWQSSVTRNLFVNVSGNYVKSEAGGFTNEIGSVGPGVAMVLLGGRAQTNLQLQYTETHVPGFGTDRDLAPNIDLSYRVTGRQTLVFRAGMRRFRTAPATPGDFSERMATLQYSAGL
jgi:hypothetical protein